MMVDKAWSELVDVEETLFEEDLDALGVMLWIVMWTLGIVDEALEVRWLHPTDIPSRSITSCIY